MTDERADQAKDSAMTDQLYAQIMNLPTRGPKGTIHTDDYLTANLTLRAIQVWQRWDLAFSVYNLADARWSDPKNEGQITSLPRSFVLLATLDF